MSDEFYIVNSGLYIQNLKHTKAFKELSEEDWEDFEVMIDEIIGVKKSAIQKFIEEKEVNYLIFGHNKVGHNKVRSAFKMEERDDFYRMVAHFVMID